MNIISMQQYSKERIASARAEADIYRELRKVKEEEENQRQSSSARAAVSSWVFQLVPSWLHQILNARLSQLRE